MVIGLNEPTDGIVDQLRDPPHIARDHRTTARQRLHQYDGNTIAIPIIRHSTGQHEQVRERHPLTHQTWRLETEHRDARRYRSGVVGDDI